MTPKELQFEEYGNEQQAIRDEINDLKEWRRLKDLEEEAIALYHDLGENLEEYTTQMRTRDQMEMELQCGRNKQIEKDLSVNSQRAWAAARSIPSAMEQERIKVATASIRADFKAGVEATMAKTKISTNATESQQASQQSEPTRSKPKKHDNASQSGSSAEAGSPSSPRQQQERTKASPEEICRQLQGQAQNKTQSPPTTIGQPTCSRPSIGAGSFKQQEEKEQPSPEETRRQFMEDVRKKAAKAGLSRHQERKSELSSEGGCSKSQASVRVQPPAPDRVPTTTKKVRTVPPQSPAYAPTRRFRDGNIFARPYGCRPAAAERQQETRINHGVYYPEGSVLVGKKPRLTKLHLGCPSSVEQSRAHNTYQSSDTSRENRVIRSTEHSPKSPSPEKSSNSTSPDRVSDSPSPEKSSKSTSPDQDPYGKPPSPSPADPSAPRVPVVQTVPIVSCFNTDEIWAKNLTMVTSLIHISSGYKTVVSHRRLDGTRRGLPFRDPRPSKRSIAGRWRSGKRSSWHAGRNGRKGYNCESSSRKELSVSGRRNWHARTKHAGRRAVSRSRRPCRRRN